MRSPVTNLHTLRKFNWSFHPDTSSVLLTSDFSMLIGYSVKLVAVLVIFAYMRSVNKKRDRESASGIQLTAEEMKEAIEAGMHDVTEIDNKGFRYIL